MGIVKKYFSGTLQNEKRRNLIKYNNFLSVEMHFNSIEGVIADEFFLSWYYGTDERKSKAWEQWLSEKPENRLLSDEATQWMKKISIREKEVTPQQTEAALRRLRDSIREKPVVEMRSRNRRWWIPAAAAIILIVAGLAWFRQQPAQKSFDSHYGTISEYKLPDGSTVTLNANSQLTIDEEWKSGEDREVWLKGEGFFKVQKTSTKDRFVVHTETMDIIVTGTQFNAISREGESSVLLTEGSVTVRTRDGKELHMLPGDFVKIENELPAKKEVDQQRVLAWTQAKLDFEKTPMTEVAKIITRHYGIKVTLDKSISNKTVTGMMSNENLDVLIQALETTGDFKITRGNNEIVISAP